MDSKIKGGGSAFPWKHTATGESVNTLTGKLVPKGVYEETYFKGLSKRELFTALAMQGIWSSFAGADYLMPTPEQIAKDAVQQADALLAELEKETI